MTVYNVNCTLYTVQCTVYIVYIVYYTLHCNEEHVYNTRILLYTGYEGVKCVTLIDDCIGNRCENGATCVDKHLEYTCTCLKGFTGLQYSILYSHL